MAGAPATATGLDIKLPLTFLITGVAAFFLLNLFVFAGIPDLAAGAVPGPAGWTMAHLTLLGWGTMIAMGAMYQLIPVALQVRVFSEKLGYIQYAIYTAGDRSAA